MWAWLGHCCLTRQNRLQTHACKRSADPAHLDSQPWRSQVCRLPVWLSIMCVGLGSVCKDVDVMMLAHACVGCVGSQVQPSKATAYAGPGTVCTGLVEHHTFGQDTSTWSDAAVGTFLQLPLTSRCRWRRSALVQKSTPHDPHRVTTRNTHHHFDHVTYCSNRAWNTD